MARKSEEQQPLAANRSGGSSAHAPAETLASYGAAADAAAAARPSGAAENGAGSGFGDVYGEEEEVEAGRRGLLVGSNGSSASPDGSHKEGAPARYSGEGTRHVWT